ncbi:MAG: PH domain-containing protein [Homoserinimonas sp.]
MTDPRNPDPAATDLPATDQTVTPGPTPQATHGSKESGVRAVGIAASLTDGEWHRMHPASPLLKGGITLIAILGIVIANLRERLISIVVPGYAGEGDPVDYVLDNGYIGFALLGLAVFLIVLIAAFYVSWRMHSFRITNEVVEVRSGILFRTNRKARLDRIQGINIVRPFFARLFGAAKLEVNQAGADANVQLSYLGSAAADDLRREVLRLASGARRADAREAEASVEAGHGLIDRRVSELLAPELDPNAAPAESVVKIPPGRLIGSTVLSGVTIFLILAIVGAVVSVVVWQNFGLLFTMIPAIIGFGSFYVNRITKSLRYSIAGTADGVRVGFGLLSTSNETLPPGRIHSVLVSQPLLWRPAGWWEIKVNRASQSTAKGAAGQANTTIMPVGDRADVMRVLALLLPKLTTDEMTRLLEDGLTAEGTAGDGFVNSPRRAAWLRWFSWQRNGFAITADAVLLRKGIIWRGLVVVPTPRVQSVSVSQGPLYRLCRLASVQLHTVAGPITAELDAVDQDAALAFFSEVADVTVQSVAADTSHRWRSGEAPA